MSKRSKVFFGRTLTGVKTNIDLNYKKDWRDTSFNFWYFLYLPPTFVSHANIWFSTPLCNIVVKKSIRHSIDNRTSHIVSLSPRSMMKIEIWRGQRNARMQFWKACNGPHRLFPFHCNVTRSPWLRSHRSDGGPAIIAVEASARKIERGDWNERGGEERKFYIRLQGPSLEQNTELCKRVC